MTKHDEDVDYRDLFRRRRNFTPVGWAKVSKDNVFLEVNDQLCEILGLTAAELVGRKFTEITPEPISTLDALSAKALAEGKIERYIFPKIYNPRGVITYAVIWVLPATSLVGRFLHFDVEVMEIPEEEYHRLVRKRRKAHVSGATSAAFAWMIFRVWLRKNKWKVVYHGVIACYILTQAEKTLRNRAEDIINRWLF